jgi:hypothetical protein
MKDPLVQKHAKEISKTFQDWAKAERKNKSPKIQPFDPSDEIDNAFYGAGSQRLEQISKLTSTAVKFDLRSPEAIDWCKKYAADQIKYINNNTKLAVRQVISRGLEEGLSPTEQTAAVKELVGLLPQHVAAVENYRAALSDLDPSTIDNLVEKYADKLLQYRADMIGRTEALDACNNGSRIATEDASDRGILPKDEYEQEWVYNEGMHDKEDCPICEPMSGERTPIGEAFSNDLMCGPAHPHCMCSTIIVRKEDSQDQTASDEGTAEE